MNANDRKRIATASIAAALRTRTSVGLPLDCSICVFDLADQLGVEVRFVDLPSMEGMYLRDLGPTILISSLRPSGRRAFTVAHELGHHHSGDGTNIDQTVESWTTLKRSPEEFAADCFAGALLMPKMAVQRAFALHQWDVHQCSPGQAYTMANYFGVGYSTIIHHMTWSLRLLTNAHADALLRVKPRQAQADALGWASQDTVWIVDSLWEGRPVDVEVGDYIFVRGCLDIEGACVEEAEWTSHGSLLRAQRPGVGRLGNGSTWSAFVRVSRPGFVGRSTFRHLKEYDEA